jgi:hypothetical protein
MREVSGKSNSFAAKSDSLFNIYYKNVVIDSKVVAYISNALILISY